MSVFIVRANTTFMTLYIQMSSTTCFGHLWPSSGRFFNNIHGKEHQGGGFTRGKIQYTIVVKIG